jgi:predicted metalloprotease
LKTIPTRRPLRARLTALAIVCVAAVALHGSGKENSTNYATVASTQQEMPAASDPVQACTPPSLAHCYNEATMRSYINRVLPMITQFFRSHYVAMSEPAGYIYIAEGQFATSECVNDSGSHVQDANSYAYCPLDQRIYLGQATIWKLYNDDGDAAPAVGLAHEWGHNVQHQTGVPEPTNDAETVDHENQADCIAGAWIQYAIQQGWFEREDVGSTVNLLRDISSAEGSDPTHGDLRQRATSMAMGLQGGLPACNNFYPSAPVYRATR